MIKKVIWKFDMMIYSLFYWRWKNRLINDPELRKQFIKYLQSWETICREPAMGIGAPPKFPKPTLFPHKDILEDK